MSSLVLQTPHIKIDSLDLPTQQPKKHGLTAKWLLVDGKLTCKWFLAEN
ncbi:hypothetical protein H6F94_24330 [Leptolyngbya sp. FACHB-261]|nr:hypothetical protein [Leptolyngbya sp. FACHB-261]